MFNKFNKLKKDSVLGAAARMAIIGALFFWLPILGSFIAGYIGGRFLGDSRRAAFAAIIPVIVVGAIIFIFSTIVTLSGASSLAGTALAMWIVVDGLPLMLGAVVGGAY